MKGNRNAGMTTPERRNICQFRNNTDSNATWHRCGTGETQPVGVIRMIKREDQEKHRCGENPGQYWKTSQLTGSNTCSVKSVWSSCSQLLRIKLCRWTSARVSQAKNYKAHFNKSGLQSCSVWCSYGNLARPRRAQRVLVISSYISVFLVPSKTDSTHSSQLSIITKYK